MKVLSCIEAAVSTHLVILGSSAYWRSLCFSLNGSPNLQKYDNSSLFLFQTSMNIFFSIKFMAKNNGNSHNSENQKKGIQNTTLLQFRCSLEVGFDYNTVTPNKPIAELFSSSRNKTVSKSFPTASTLTLKSSYILTLT